jgi:IrrE N-terminal-like domain
MAAEDRPTLELSREQRLADTLVRRFNLVPPVDVHALAWEFAELEHDDIPGGCDGLVVGLDARSRSQPLIVLANTANVVRERFTVAHELGHVLLPWHGTSSYACDVTAEISLQAYLAKRAEAEANRFAADLLVPSGWLAETVESVGLDSTANLLRAIRPAQVSAHVACLALSRQLPAGRVFAVLEGDGRVALAGASPDTSVDPPKRGDALDQRLDRFADQREVVTFGSRSVVWWTFARTEVGEDTDPRTSREVLDALLERHAADADEARSFHMSFAGIVGSANNSVRLGRRFSEAELHERLRRAFTKSRKLPEQLLDDPEFSTWLRKRAREVAGS